MGFVVVDVETTGLDPQHDRIIEVAAARLNRHGDITGRWSTLINPGRDVPAVITTLTGISDTDLVHAPSFPAVQHAVATVLRSGVIVGHNVAFDLAFLRAAFARAGTRPPLRTLAGLDTLQGAQVAWPGLGRGGYRLTELTHRFGGDTTDSHTATADVAMTVNLFAALRPHLPHMIATCTGR